MAESCPHIDSIDDVKGPTKRECEECVKIGSSWVHLRTCQTCGGTRCCDSSPNRHASQNGDERARVDSHLLPPGVIIT